MILQLPPPSVRASLDVQSMASLLLHAIFYGKGLLAATELTVKLEE
jgi:hypothetical protein